MEHVVLVDEDGQAIGTAEKMANHHAETPLHLAFSCYIFNPSGEFLLTRRADSKRVFPGVWTNSCCGHPQLGEALPEAVDRRVREELGISLYKVTLLIPRFRYRASMDGIVENELCPVYAGFTHDTVAPDPAEVGAARWVDWDGFRHQVASGQIEVSPWCALQLPGLAALGPDPSRWPEADPSQLPPAALPPGRPLSRMRHE